ncbi:MAG: hypothetical protein IKS41_06250 [Alphaproteobacteria bacterium]|nr:hypothetical protein [Alphaproteobacteria bacterium]
MAEADGIQYLSGKLEEWSKLILKNMGKSAQESDKKIQGKIQELTGSIQGMEGEIKRRFQGIEDTLGSVRREQSILNDALVALPEKIQRAIVASIDQIVQDRVTQVLEAQMPKIIEAVQQQVAQTNQGREGTPVARSTSTEKPAGERYADDEMVKKTIPKGLGNRLQTMAQAVQSGATTKGEIFRTEVGHMSVGQNTFIRIENRENGTGVIEGAQKDAALYRLAEGKKLVKGALYKDGEFSYSIAGHRANVIDKLDEKKDGKGKTLEEKKEIVRQYRQEHPKNGGR